MILNDTKYTLEFVQEELSALLKALKDDKSIVYIWELFTEKKYSRQRYSEWITKYWTDPEVKTISDTIKEILETRAIKWAMTNELNATSVIFHLKNNYKWVDKQEIDTTLKWELKVNTMKQASDEELLAILE